MVLCTVNSCILRTLYSVLLCTAEVEVGVDRRNPGFGLALLHLRVWLEEEGGGYLVEGGG